MKGRSIRAQTIRRRISCEGQARTRTSARIILNPSTLHLVASTLESLRSPEPSTRTPNYTPLKPPGPSGPAREASKASRGEQRVEWRDE